MVTGDPLAPSHYAVSREVDLIPTWHAAARYGKGAARSEAFAHRYGYDLARWDGFRTVMDMRDLVQLTGPLRQSRRLPETSASAAPAAGVALCPGHDHPMGGVVAVRPAARG